MFAPLLHGRELCLYAAVMLIAQKYLSALIVAVLVLTGQSAAVARGMPGPAGYAHLCLGGSVVMVPVDADGAPTGPAHLCPDATLTLMSWVDSGAQETWFSTKIHAAYWSEPSQLSWVAPAVAASARAPPVGV